MSINILLYTTVGCHLCEQAEDILRTVVSEHSALRWAPVEISDDAALVEAYGLRIPVIRVDGVQEDLGWPFDADAVVAYVARHRI